MIDYEIFLDWVKEHFDHFTESSGEIKVNSIFVDDYKGHLWINPNKNAYHCWKSGHSGNLYDLVSKVTKCPYHEAKELFSDDGDLRSLESKLDSFFERKEKPKITTSSLSLPPNTFAINELNEMFKGQVTNYLSARKIQWENLLFCTSGKYRNRIIIPYYNRDGKLIYWNGRDISNSPERYMGPDKNCGVAKGDVIYASEWPTKGSKVYLTEGEFDAISLTKCGITGVACGGKELSDKQMELLSPYRISICFDTDKSGADALNKIGDKLIGNGVNNISYVRPPVNKAEPDKKMDWNKMLVEFGEKIVASYVFANEKPFSQWTSSALRFNNR